MPACSKGSEATVKPALSYSAVARSWAASGRHTALLKQLARVEDDADRLELVEQHRIWARDVEPISRM